jgi:hypothetical protein
MNGYLELTRSISFQPSPLFGDRLQGDPFVFDFTAANPRVAEYVTDDYDTFQAQVFADLEATSLMAYAFSASTAISTQPSKWKSGSALPRARRLAKPARALTPGTGSAIPICKS